MESMMNCKLSDQQMTLDSAIAHADQLASQLSGDALNSTRSFG
jgi:hypothetical protein